MGPLGWTEMVIIFVVALLVFGPEKLPDLAKTAAKGLREFKKATDGLKSNWEEHLRDTENPVNDIKRTFEEAKSEVVEASASILDDETPAPEPSTSTEEFPAVVPEETKPDANSETKSETKPDAKPEAKPEQSN